MKSIKLFSAAVHLSSVHRFTCFIGSVFSSSLFFWGCLLVFIACLCVCLLPSFLPSIRTSVGSVEDFEHWRSLVRFPARLILFLRVGDCHCNRIHSSLTSVYCFDDGYVRKQPVGGYVRKQPLALEEYCGVCWLTELQESMDRCTCHRNIMLKTALNTMRSVNQSFLHCFTSHHLTSPHLYLPLHSSHHLTSPHLTFTYLSFPHITLPYASLPHLLFPYLIFFFLSFRSFCFPTCPCLQ